VGASAESEHVDAVGTFKIIHKVSANRCLNPRAAPLISAPKPVAVKTSAKAAGVW
jgi:hypothetical protein